VHPHPVARRAHLDRDDPRRRVGQQLAVVADEQDRLGRRGDPLLQPALARHVEEVVRLVEQQHLVRATQQRLQDQPLLLAAGQSRQVPVLASLEGDAERCGAARCPSSTSAS
jgi:hypothetical protein